jgi:hypothetical protein
MPPFPFRLWFAVSPAAVALSYGGLQSSAAARPIDHNAESNFLRERQLPDQLAVAASERANKEETGNFVMEHREPPYRYGQINARNWEKSACKTDFMVYTTPYMIHLRLFCGEKLA